MKNGKVTSVSSTAIMMAAVRACETLREDRLFVDPFAAKLAGDEAVGLAAPVVKGDEEQGRPYGQVRTRFLDDFLSAHAEDYSQVVLLGAGLDARAYRLELPKDLKFFEIDQPNIIDYKNEVLASDMPTCDRRVIAANLGEEAWVDLLLEAGFVPEEPSLWILEGFIYYLHEEQAVSLMEKINGLSAAGSRLGCDLINTTICNGSDEWAKMWHFGCDEPELFFQDLGWDATVLQPGDPTASYERFTFQFSPRNEPQGFHVFFVFSFFYSKSRNEVYS